MNSRQRHQMLPRKKPLQRIELVRVLLVSRITLTRPHSHIAQNMAEHRLWMFDVDVDDGSIIPSSGSMTGRSAQFFFRDGIKRRRRHVLMEPLHSAFGSLADGSILRHSAAGLQLASCMKVSNSRHCQRRHRAHSLLPPSICIAFDILGASIDRFVHRL